MARLVDAVWRVLLDLAPWLFVGALVAGVLHVVIPPGWLGRSFRGRVGVLKAALFGVPLPLCSCSVIPAGIGLKRDGASDGASVAFLISTPQTGVDSILVSQAFLGWPFALFKVGAALFLGIVGGLWTAGKDDGVVVESAPSTQRRTIRDGFDHALEVISSVWGWLAIGVLLSALITVVAPAEGLASLGVSGVTAMLVTLALAVPLYVCATASVPIAAALVHAGFPLGAALVFLVAGPATNVATIGAVYRTFGKRVVAIYLSTIIVGSLVLGWLFDGVLVGQGHGLSHAAHEHSSSAVASFAAVVLLALMGYFAWNDARSWWRLRAVNAEKNTLAIDVAGLTCSGCARKLEGRIQAEAGVTGVTVQLGADAPGSLGIARVQGKVSPERLAEIVQAAGFQFRGVHGKSEPT